MPAARIYGSGLGWHPDGMFGESIDGAMPTAAEARGHVVELEAERALASTTGIADVDSYMSDLEAEIEVWSRLYVTSAVTEIATLRAELFGIQVG